MQMMIIIFFFFSERWESTRFLIFFLNSCLTFFFFPPGVDGVGWRGECRLSDVCVCVCVVSMCGCKKVWQCLLSVIWNGTPISLMRKGHRRFIQWPSQLCGRYKESTRGLGVAAPFETDILKAFWPLTMLPMRKSVPRSSRQSDHTKTSWPS